MTLSNLGETVTVTIYPDEMLETPVKKQIRDESVTGLAYSSTVNTRKSWNVKAVVEDSEKATLEDLDLEDYVVAEIDYEEYTCILSNLRFNPLRKWGDAIYEVNFSLEDRGW